MCAGNIAGQADTSVNQLASWMIEHPDIDDNGNQTCHSNVTDDGVVFDPYANDFPMDIDDAGGIQVNIISKIRCVEITGLGRGYIAPVNCQVFCRKKIKQWEIKQSGHMRPSTKKPTSCLKICFRDVSFQS